jgi:hypothetical protein
MSAVVEATGTLLYASFSPLQLVDGAIKKVESPWRVGTILKYLSFLHFDFICTLGAF